MSTKTIIKNACGLTVIELIVGISIVMVVITLAIPSFLSMIDKQRLTSACDEAYEQLMYARSSAIKINKSVSIAFKPTPFSFDQDKDGVKERYNWCIGLNDASTTGCNCAGTVTEANKCTVGGRQEVIRFQAESNVSIYNNDVTFGGHDKTTFNARDGTALAGHITLGSKLWVCKITLSSMGRIRFNKSKDGQFIVPLGKASSLE